MPHRRQLSRIDSSTSSANGIDRYPSAKEGARRFTVGKQFSARPHSPGEIAIHADAIADMFCAYLEAFEPGFARADAVRRPARSAHRSRAAHRSPA
ncbi:MAG: hypothetical protein ACREFX_05770 [Opitutaceae bacterium]